MLRVRASKLVVETGEGRFSNRLDFSDGLNLISASNSQGKSTALMALVYALGLEGILGPGNQMPLKPAAYKVIENEDGSELQVLASHVIVEFENGRGDSLTALRHVKSESTSTDLIQVWPAGILTNPSTVIEPFERFTRLPGSAQHDAGWHAEIASFAGWDIPDVSTWSGASAPLYMQVFAPLFVREQLHGWSSIFGAIPRYLRVRDPGRRSVEFLLGLDAYVRATRREELKSAKKAIGRDWKSVIAKFDDASEALGGRVDGVPDSPTVSWPPEVVPVARFFISNEWLELTQFVQTLRGELSQINAESVPTSESSAGESAIELTEAEDELAALSAAVFGSRQELRIQEAEAHGLEVRLKAVEADRIRYKDALRIRTLGGIGRLAELDPHCPTCDQELPPTLDGATLESPVYTLEDNLLYLDKEVESLRATQADGMHVLGASRERTIAQNRRLGELRSRVRALRTSLVAPGQSPSVATIERLVRLTAQIDELEKFSEDFADLLEALGGLSDQYRVVEAELASLKEGETSEADRLKLTALAESVAEQLDAYGYKSFDGVEVDFDTYLPAKGGFDLSTDSSASDTIRLIWAYVAALQEVGHKFETNHPGMVILDEPGQQQMEPDDLLSLFRRLASNGSSKLQSVVATSVDPALLEKFALDHPDVNILSFAGRLISEEG